jgi:ribosomal protein L37E
MEFYSDCCGEPVYGLNTNTCSECGSDCKALSWEEYLEEHPNDPR